MLRVPFGAEMYQGAYCVIEQVYIGWKMHIRFQDERITTPPDLGMNIKIKQLIARPNNFDIDTSHDLGCKQLEIVFQSLQVIAFIGIETTKTQHFA